MGPHFDEVYNFIKNGLDKGNILVHCGAGISRVNISSIIVQYLCDYVSDEREEIFFYGHPLDSEESEISGKPKQRF